MRHAQDQVCLLKVGLVPKMGVGVLAAPWAVFYHFVLVMGSSPAEDKCFSFLPLVLRMHRQALESHSLQGSLL